MTERPMNKPQDNKFNKPAKAPDAKHEHNHEIKSEDSKIDQKTESKIEQTIDNSNNETKSESKKEEKKESKPVAQKIKKKEDAKVNAQSLPLSKKHSMYICNFIKNKPIDLAIEQLGEVIKFKRVIPMIGEIPHRSEPGVMSGRYPIKACSAFIQILKGLKGNVIVNQMDLEKTRIVIASASWASRQHMKNGARFKRTNVNLVAKEVQSNNKKEKKQ